MPHKFLENFKNANKDNPNEMVFISNIWNNVSKNVLAEKGLDLKINVEDVINAQTPEKKVDFEAMDLPDFKIDDHEIEFVDPDRIRREQEVKEQKEKEFEGKVMAPVIMGGSLTMNKRRLFLDTLKAKRMGSISMIELKTLYKVTELSDRPKNKDGEVDEDVRSEYTAKSDKDVKEQYDSYLEHAGGVNLDGSESHPTIEEMRNQLEQVDDYINGGSEKDENEGLDQNELLQRARERNPNADRDIVVEEEEFEFERQKEEEDDEDEGEQQEGEGDQVEAEGEGDDKEEDIVSEENQSPQKEEIDPAQKAEEIRKLKKRIAQRRQASKFLEEEAELGSDNEINDTMLKNIDKNDREEILDRKLQFLDEDIEDLIDNNNINESINDLASKFLQDDIALDKQQTVNLITQITSGNRKKRKQNIVTGLEDDPENFLMARMRQKRNDLESRDYQMYNKDDDDVKQRILKVCEDEGLDEDEKRRIVEEEIRRKVKLALKKADNNLRRPTTNHLATSSEINKTMIEHEKPKGVVKKKFRQGFLINNHCRKSIGSQLFNHQ